jgi:uncharacterized protein (TIGR02118 family)
VVKVVTFLRRRAGMPVDEFQAYWRTRHPEVVTRLPGVRRYVQSHAVHAGPGSAALLYDGIAEVWADDTAALRAMTASPDYARVQADEAVFIDRSTMGIVVTEEHVVVDAAVPESAVKLVEFLARKPGLPVEEFQRHWRDRHGPLVARVPGLRRHVQSPTRLAAYAGGRAPAWDGIAIGWFDSAAVLEAAPATPAGARAAAELAQIVAAGGPPAIVTREHVIVA